MTLRHTYDTVARAYDAQLADELDHKPLDRALLVVGGVVAGEMAVLAEHAGMTVAWVPEGWIYSGGESGARPVWSDLVTHPSMLARALNTGGRVAERMKRQLRCAEGRDLLRQGSGRASASGTLTAPFPGIHGWYWENTTGEPVTVTLATAGYYNLAHEFRTGQPVINKTFQ